MNMAEITDLSFLQSTDVMVPFLFTLAVTFGVLEVTNVFKNKAVNFLIALALSIFAITSPTFVDLLWNYFGDITVFFIAMFLVAFAMEALGIRKDKNLTGSSVVILSAVLFLLLTLGFYYEDKIPSLPFIGGGQNALLLFAIVIILAVFWSAYRLQAATSASQ